MSEKPKESFPKSKEAKEQEEKDKQRELGIQFNLDSTEKKNIAQKIKDRRDESISSHTRYMEIRADSIRQYEGIKEYSDDPWPGHSNISTMITTVACDLLHSKLFPMVWNEQSITWEGREEHDVETAEVNKTVMGWVTSVDMKLQDKIDDLVHLLVVDGTIAVKEIWTPYWTWVTRKIPKITYRSFETGKYEYDVKYDYVRRERCELDIRPLERVHTPYLGDTTVPRWEDETEYIIDDRWYSPDDLREMKAKGQLDPSVNIDDLIEAMNQMPQFSSTSKERMNAEGTTAPIPNKNNYKLLCAEGYIKHAVVPGDEIRKQCIFLVCLEPLFYLSGKALHNVSRIGRRPWIIRPFLRRPGRTKGKGIPELVKNLHKMIDALRNQRIDAGNRVIGGGGYYRPASGNNPRRLKVGPSTWVPVDDPKNDVNQLTYNMSGINWSTTEERFLMELVERLTYLTPAMLGRETANRPTARGTLAVIQQGEQKFGLIGRRVQLIFCDLLTDIRQKYEENMHPEMWERILGKKRSMTWPSPEYMAGMYDAKMQLDLTSSDIESRRMRATLVYQTMAFDPLVMQNPAFMWEIRAEYLRVHRFEPVEKFIGPRPPTEMTEKDADDIFTVIEQEKMPDLGKVDPTTVLPRLMDLKRSERYERFTPAAKAIFNAVVRELQVNYIDTVQKGMALYGQLSPFTRPEGAGGGNQASGLRGLAPQGTRPVGAGASVEGGPGQANAGGAS